MSFTVTVLAFSVLLLLPVLIHHTYKDYLAFLALGPGGTPSTVPGYLRTRTLSIFALRDAYTAPPIPEDIQPRTGFLTTLPTREGPRPRTLGIAPHRQINARSSNEVFQLLSSRIKTLAHTNTSTLRLGTSCFEKHGTGLFCLYPQHSTCSGEICHAHPSDGSMHLTLHPADAKIVIENGWAERHPLAKGGWFERFVPAGFLMIYAPRDDAEIAVIMAIVGAAAWWVGGREIMSRRFGDELCAEHAEKAHRRMASDIRVRCRIDDLCKLDGIDSRRDSGIDM